MRHANPSLLGLDLSTSQVRPLPPDQPLGASPLFLPGKSGASALRLIDLARAHVAQQTRSPARQAGRGRCAGKRKLSVVALLLLVLIQINSVRASDCCDVAPDATDWLTLPSTFTHDPKNGQRVSQYAAIESPTAPMPPNFLSSGYTHTRSNLNFRGSQDNYHRVETWGAPVRPYGEWQRPFRPYSVPYDLWGAPFAGFNDLWPPFRRGNRGGLGPGFGRGPGSGYRPGFPPGYPGYRPWPGHPHRPGGPGHPGRPRPDRPAPDRPSPEDPAQ